jgi:hypothetical protein
MSIIIAFFCGTTFWSSTKTGSNNYSTLAMFWALNFMLTVEEKLEGRKVREKRK